MAQMLVVLKSSRTPMGKTMGSGGTGVGVGVALGEDVGVGVGFGVGVGVALFAHAANNSAIVNIVKRMIGRVRNPKVVFILTILWHVLRKNADSDESMEYYRNDGDCYPPPILWRGLFSRLSSMLL
jgi:hypothetical protein